MICNNQVCRLAKKLTNVTKNFLIYEGIRLKYKWSLNFSFS